MIVCHPFSAVAFRHGSSIRIRTLSSQIRKFVIEYLSALSALSARDSFRILSFFRMFSESKFFLRVDFVFLCRDSANPSELDSALAAPSVL